MNASIRSLLRPVVFVAAIAASVAPGEGAVVTAGGPWAPAQSCTLAEASSAQGCTATYLVTLTSTGGAASGTLQAFVDLLGPEGSPDEHAPGALEVALVPVAR